MKILIIEDEKPALENLLQELQQIDENIQVVGTCDSIEQSIHWLRMNLQPDLILMDIQLSDGLSFTIFKSVTITCPVIFITAFDKYLTQAFDYNSIDYLLKPVEMERLKNAIKKYKNLQTYFVNNYSSLFDYLSNHDKKKSRILVKEEWNFKPFAWKTPLIFLRNTNWCSWLIKTTGNTSRKKIISPSWKKNWIKIFFTGPTANSSSMLIL